MEVHKPHEDVKTYYINYECNPQCRQDPKENIIANSLNKVLGSKAVVDLHSKILDACPLSVQFFFIFMSFW